MILFWLMIVFMLLVAISFISYPIFFRVKNNDCSPFSKRIIIFCSVAICIVAILLYFYWGNSADLARHYAQQQKIETLRKELGTPVQVISRLKQQLSQDPSSAQGWNLLAKLYFSQQQFKESAQAYAKLTQLKPHDNDVLVQFAQALYFANHHKMNPEITAILQQVLQKEPQNPLAINLLAISAYQHHAYQEAIDYWQQLLNQYPPNSDEYQSITTAMKNAQRAMQQSNPAINAIKLIVNVKIAPTLQTKIQPDDIVYIYARDAKGSAMPLAITRIKTGQLPTQVILTQAMMMNPSKSLKDAKEIMVVARISKTGNAIPAKGDLQGKSAVLPLSTAMSQPTQIIINELIR